MANISSTRARATSVSRSARSKTSSTRRRMANLASAGPGWLTDDADRGLSGEEKAPLPRSVSQMPGTVVSSGFDP